jgi:hypothetical protein
MTTAKLRVAPKVPVANILTTTTTMIATQTTALLVLVLQQVMLLAATEVVEAIVATGDGAGIVTTTPSTLTRLHQEKTRSVASQASKSCWAVWD